jgi:hypothetical protein
MLAGLPQSGGARPAKRTERLRRRRWAPRRHMPGAGPEWWYRVPKVLVGELREDVERLRLTEAGGHRGGILAA